MQRLYILTSSQLGYNNGVGVRSRLYPNKVLYWARAEWKFHLILGYVAMTSLKGSASEERPCHYLRTTHRPSTSITIMPIQFDTTKITERGVLLPMPPISQPITAAIPEVQSAASAAVTSVESAIGSVMPKNRSLGTDYFCSASDLPTVKKCRETFHPTEFSSGYRTV